jgi:two-component system, chemotaxis family, CheB/CheR fusion protein
MTSRKQTRKTPKEKTPPTSAQTEIDSTESGKSSRKNSFPIVGIGASAGGLEALTGLLKALSPDLGMAFIFVPHLDPSRESAFSQILARTTAMPVLEIKEGTKVQPNHVYVIPPNCDLTIADAFLHISNRLEPRSVNMTVDIFFRSLAADQGSNAIGIVLSGTASDGTSGLTAIKGEGGITFAQDTRSAKYDGMPASAIAAGCVDFVLPPDGIAQELARIRRHPYVSGSYVEQIEAENTGTDVAMGQVFRLLRRATKVDFSEYKPPTIGRRIQRRMALHKIEKLSEYVALLHRDRNEVNALYQDLLINVTSFFRNPEAFETLKHVLYPAILKSHGSSSTPLRIWVPGCSTGEETYSHAISLVEFLGEERTEVPIQIFGTDLSENAIQRARAGIFKESIEADVNPVRLRRFFHKADGGYQISKTIRDLCIFSTQNVFSDPPFSRMDLVSCRNVMIYLSQALQKRVIPIFHYALNPTGFLMIGNTEGLLGAGSELFEMADKKQKIYRKKLVSTPVTFGFSIGQPQQETDSTESQPSPAKPTDVLKVPVELQREADRLLLSRYAPPAVVVNDQLEIIQSRGRTGTFLELPPGKASLNLLKMARPGLLYELQSAIDSARKNGIEAQRENVRIEGNGKPKIITLRVVPFKTPVQEQYSFLIVFEPHESESTDAVVEKPAPELTEGERAEQDKLMAQLKQELAASKEYLQSIIETQEATNEELQSANEEIQSGNEELQSTNEELQTSKEELESANEELHTVNEEMQHRNELLTQLNNDLTNLLNSINLPMVMVGADLSVRRFTPQATGMFGLMASDVGRAIPRLKLKIDSSQLEQMMLDVIQEVQPKQFQVQDNDSNWWNLRITPYRTLDNRIDGVVLSVIDSIQAIDHPGKASTAPKKLAVKKRGPVAKAIPKRSKR